MKKILIGTHNAGKFRELSFLLSKKIKKISPNVLGIKSPRETGKTFTANAILKARYFSQFTNYPVISDDSGLCIKSLKNKPGIYSARWAKKYGNFNKAMKFILKKMEKKKDRSATFVCCLALIIKGKGIVSVTGKIQGSISFKIKGIKGFGYDPIFIPNKKIITFGQMQKIKKIKMDHRYVAFKKLKTKIKTL